MEKDLSDSADLVRKIIESLKEMLEHRLEEDSGYYDNADLKRLLNVSDRTLYRWRQQQLLQFIRLSGRIYYPKSAVRKLRYRNRGKR